MGIPTFLKVLSPLADIIGAAMGGSKKGKSKTDRSEEPSYKRGGTKRGYGAAKLHKNERIKSPKRKRGRMSGRA